MRTQDHSLVGDRAELHRLLETLPAAAYTCDPDGLITYFNPHALELWGREPKLNDPIDRFCGSFKLFATDGTPIRHDAVLDGARPAGPSANTTASEIVIERPDGERLTALAHANPIRDEAGKLLGAVNVLVDITDRKRVEDALRDSRPLEERVPGDAGPRAAQPAGAASATRSRSCSSQGTADAGRRSGRST